MTPLFLLLGLLLGLGIGKWGDLPFSLGLTCVAILLLFVSAQKGKWKAYALGLGIGLAFALLSKLLWYPLGNVYIVTHRGNGYVFLSTLFGHYHLEDKQSLYEIGDIVRIDGKPAPYKATTYESRFSFASYLSSYGIDESLSGKATFVFQVGIRYGNAEKAFLSHFDTESAAILGKLLFGASSGESKALEHAAELDLLYLLSSGGFLFGGLLRFGDRFLSEFISKKKAKTIVLVIGLLFLPLGLRKIGILRVLVTRSLELLFFKKRYPRVTLLSVSAIILLVINPYFAYQSAFLLGYGLGFLFVVVGPLLQPIKGFKKKALSFLLLRLLILPVHLLSGSIHLLSSLFSLVLFPLALLLSFLGYISFATFPFTHILSGLIQALSFLLNAAKAVDVPLVFPMVSALGILIYLLCYLLSLHFHCIGTKKLRNIAIISPLALYLISCVPILHPVTSEVIFVNVGQGDCIVLRDHNSVVMMDTGGVSGFDMATETLVPYLLKRRIYHIDALIASHGDYDHVGAADSLMKHFKVRRYIREPSDFPLKVGRMEFINYNNYDMEEENDKSLVLSTKVGGKTYLLTGDAPKEVEQKIVRDYPHLRCDILKAGHHGSSTSSCAEFLDLLQPKEAIISCGGKNRYGHPNADVIARLRQRSITIRRTDEEGSIVYYGFG